MVPNFEFSNPWKKNRVDFRPHVIFQNKATELNFMMHMSDTVFCLWIKSYYWISLNPVKIVEPFDVVLKQIMKFLVKSDWKIRFLMNFSYNIARLRLLKKQILVGYSWFSVEKWIFGLWLLEKGTEHNWALFQLFFLTNSTTIFRLKIVPESRNA